MSSKDFVQNLRPNMRSESHIKKDFFLKKRTYWLIRERGNSMYFASGDTEANAWKAAKDFLIEENEKIN